MEYPVYANLAATPYTDHVFQQVHIGPGATGAAFATCPDTSIVVGGGYVTDTGVTVYTQDKYKNGWRGDGWNNSKTTLQMTVYAVCLHNVSGAYITKTHGQVSLTPGNEGQAVAICPAGSTVTGGGFHGFHDGSLRVYNSSKIDYREEWQTWAENFSSSAKTLHAYAICLWGSGGTTMNPLQFKNISPRKTAYLNPKCANGTLVTGGGFAADTEVTIFSNSGPYAGNEWRLYAMNTNWIYNKGIIGYAICLSLPELTEYDIHLPLISRSHVP
jgi:hypothetical protein